VLAVPREVVVGQPGDVAGAEDHQSRHSILDYSFLTRMVNSYNG
jgi:hypothetical protein